MKREWGNRREAYSKNLGQSRHLEDVVVDGRIILK